MSDASRQTDNWINQYPCQWIKSHSSSHVLGRLQPAAHFVRGSSADPWASVGDCPDANQEGEPIHRCTIRLDICILGICSPWKSANTFPPPPTATTSHPPPGQHPLTSGLASVHAPPPCPPLLPSWPCQARLQYLTRPRDGLGGVQGKALSLRRLFTSHFLSQVHLYYPPPPKQKIKIKSHLEPQRCLQTGPFPRSIPDLQHLFRRLWNTFPPFSLDRLCISASSGGRLAAASHHSLFKTLIPFGSVLILSLSCTDLSVLFLRGVKEDFADLAFFTWAPCLHACRASARAFRSTLWTSSLLLGRKWVSAARGRKTAFGRRPGASAGQRTSVSPRRGTGCEEILGNVNNPSGPGCRKEEKEEQVFIHIFRYRRGSS